MYSLCYFHLFPQPQNAQWHWADTCDTKAVDLTCLSMQGLAIDRLKNAMTLYHISCWWFCVCVCFFNGPPWTSPFTSFFLYIYIYYIHTHVFDIDNSTTLCMYIHIIYIHIHIYRILFLYAHYLSPFGNCHWSSTWRVPSLQNLRSDSLWTDVGDL